MKEGEHSTVDVAFDNFLRAEYAEWQSAHWAPEHLPKATKKRIAAAQVLHRMGVDISLMRAQRIEAAMVLLAERFAAEGVRAKVRRRGTRVTVECVEQFNASEALRAWALTKGLSWASTHHGHRTHEPASTLEFRLQAPGQEPYVPEGMPTRSDSPELDDDGEDRLRRSCDAADEAIIAAGRATIEHAQRGARYEPSRAEQFERTVSLLLEAMGAQGPCGSDWRDWSG